MLKSESFLAPPHQLVPVDDRVSRTVLRNDEVGLVWAVFVLGEDQRRLRGCRVFQGTHGVRELLLGLGDNMAMRQPRSKSGGRAL